MKEIKEVIAEIETKVAKMNASLAQVETENETLAEELSVVHEKLKQRSLELSDFKEKYNVLLHQQAQKEGSGEEIAADKNVQIDALVREIDDCINQLKEVDG